MELRPKSTPLGRAMRACCLLACVSCTGPSEDILAMERFAREKARQEAAPPARRRVTVRDPFTKKETEVRELAALVDGTEVPDGVERLFWPQGKIRSVRHFLRGEPVGIWWSWWRNGALRSAYVYDKTEETLMVWWHANGIVSAEGMALDGRRTGPWRYWHENGSLESEGAMSGGQRIGDWTFYDEDGEWTERGSYVSGKRSGAWEFRDQPAFAGRQPVR